MNTKQLFVACVALCTCGIAQAEWQIVSNSPIKDITIASDRGTKQALVRETTVSNLIPSRVRPATVTCVLIPEGGHACVGFDVGTNVVLLDGQMFGITMNERTQRLGVFASTNRYPTGIANTEQAMDVGLTNFVKSAPRFIYLAPIQVDLATLLGRIVFEDGIEVDGPSGSWTRFPDDKHGEGKLQSVTVKGTNMVATLGGKKGMTAQIAFDTNLRPIWAATNGVAIGSVPTNTVVYTEYGDNTLIRNVIY
jgi:hypothetical protein